jgi:hypothetical protein
MALLTWPVGRPSYQPMVRYKSFLYQAASWKQARRVVAKVELHCGGVVSRVGFIVTNLETSSRAVVRLYNKRGTAEQWIKEGEQAVAIGSFGYLMSTRGRTGLLRRGGRVFALKTGLDPCLCKPNSLGASLNQEGNSGSVR